MITLTDTAAVKVKELLDAEGDAELALRVAVRPGGCSGFSLRDVLRQPTSPPTTSTADFGGVKVVVDPSSAQLLDGATLDYKDGLQSAGFAIDNPNATAHLRLRPVASAESRLRPAARPASSAASSSPCVEASKSSRVHDRPGRRRRRTGTARSDRW